MLRIALRPRWIAALVLALGIAAAFALLSQWQISRSVSSTNHVERPTETVLPLIEVAQPQHAARSASDGQRVTVEGSFEPSDVLVMADRLNGGEPGYWVVAHFKTASSADIPVALGWTPQRAEAERAADDFAAGTVATTAAGTATVNGRFVVDEAPQSPGYQDGELSSVSSAALVNLWQPNAGGFYNGYIVSDVAPAGLERIDSPVPDLPVELNWLNIFYAVEWVIFAGFAIFLWWRLVRDVWLREREERESAQLN